MSIRTSKGWKVMFVSILCWVLTSFDNPKQKVLLQKVMISAYKYSIYEESIYIEEDSILSTYFSVYENKAPEPICRHIKVAVNSNDEVMVSGSYWRTDTALYFREYYKEGFRHDSVLSQYIPNLKGDLVLKTTVEYKDGVMSRTNYGNFKH